MQIRCSLFSSSSYEFWNFSLLPFLGTITLRALRLFVSVKLPNQNSPWTQNRYILDLILLAPGLWGLNQATMSLLMSSISAVTPPIASESRTPKWCYIVNDCTSQLPASRQEGGKHTFSLGCIFICFLSRRISGRSICIDSRILYILCTAAAEKQECKGIRKGCS